jgi:hypothetical protein
VLNSGTLARAEQFWNTDEVIVKAWSKMITRCKARKGTEEPPIAKAVKLVLLIATSNHNAE